MSATLDRIIQITAVNRKYWNEFDVTTDGGNQVAGWLCREESERLGMLAVTQVNGAERLEFIYAMPKIPYPYQRADDNARLVIPVPQNATDARFNVKLDGTCIIFYPLTDEAGEILEVVPRTRLQPTLTPSRWGDWPALLDDAMPDRTNLERAVREQSVILCFELWGYRNPHLVRYETPLALTLHTAIRHKRPVSYRILADIAGRYDLPLVESIEATKLDGDSLRGAYQAWQEEMERRNQAAGQDTFVEEGAVLVISTPRTAIYYKCKPPSIEEIHWAMGQTLSKEIILQALYKMRENGYDFAAGQVEDLMTELEADFDRPLIEIQADLIRRVWMEYVMELQRKEWLRHLVAESGLDPHATSLPDMMRYLSQHYPANQMSWVYNTVRELYGV